MTSPKAHRFELGSFPLACGETVSAAQLDYRVFGELNRERSNLVLYPSSYGAWPEDIAWAVGPILDPSEHCVVLVSQFGNGRSSSPSTGDPGLAGGRWPVDHRDNVAAQRRLLEEEFAVTSPALIYGWSMGAQQAYHWAVLEPERTVLLAEKIDTSATEVRRWSQDLNISRKLNVTSCEHVAKIFSFFLVNLR